MNIIIYAICKNEAQFAERFMGSCAEADGVYVLDTGSTDGTPERLRALARPGDLILTVGAGDIFTVGEALLREG